MLTWTSLCANWYDVSAEAPGYEPSVKERVAVYSDTQTIQDFSLLPLVNPPVDILLDGPDEGD